MPCSDMGDLYSYNIEGQVAQTRRYESMPKGLRAMAALAVLRNKAIKPLLAAAQELRPSRGAQNPRPIDTHYDTIRVGYAAAFSRSWGWPP